jgi:putative tricarboxylic transport membrane protein
MATSLGKMNREKITGIFLFGLGLAVFLKSLTYPLGTLRKPGGGLFPLIASTLLMGFTALLTIQAFRGKEADQAAQAPFFPEKQAPRRIFLGFAGLLGYRYLLPLIGFAPSTAVFILFLSRFLGKYSWVMSIGFAILTALAAYYLFQVWLKIPMPRPYFGI